jgi:hypothetical protein
MIEYIESNEKSPKVIALSCARIYDILLKHSNELSGVENYSKLKSCMDFIENTRKTSVKPEFYRANQSFQESKSSQLIIEALKQRGDSFFNSSNDKADHAYIHLSDKKISNNQSRIENRERDKLLAPASLTLVQERQEEILLNLKDLKSTQ